MKTLIFILFFSLLFYNGCAQDSAYNFQYPRRFTPVVTHGKLTSAQFVNDITPEFWQRLSVPYVEYYELEKRRKTQGYYNANTLVDYVSVEILTSSNGKIFSAQNSSDKLTAEQKNILAKADLGSDIQIKIKYKYKIESPDKPKIVEGNIAVEVVPETEAEFPGGVAQRMAYFKKNVTDKLSGAKDFDNLSYAIVSFTINEIGQVQDVKLQQTTTNAKIDKLLLKTFGNMPKWTPARDAKGKVVKQKFTIPFGGGC